MLCNCNLQDWFQLDWRKKSFWMLSHGGFIQMHSERPESWKSAATGQFTTSAAQQSCYLDANHVIPLEQNWHFHGDQTITRGNPRSNDFPQEAFHSFTWMIFESSGLIVFLCTNSALSPSGTFLIGGHRKTHFAHEKVTHLDVWCQTTCLVGSWMNHKDGSGIVSTDSQKQLFCGDIL